MGCFKLPYYEKEDRPDFLGLWKKETASEKSENYYPFGMQTANSWTREAVTGNNYLANGGTELNATTQLYDLHYRNYDAALGRMFQVDPMAGKYASLTPYNYSFNNPAGFSDPSGADPDLTVPNPNYQYYYHNGAGAMGYPGLTYDDTDNYRSMARGDYNCASCWRTDNMLGWLTGGGPGIVRDAGGSSGWTLRMGNMTINYNDLEDGSHYFAFENGIGTGYNYMSTGHLFHEAGMIIARGYYGGNGSMPAGYMPANHRPRIALRTKNIVLATLPRVNSPRSVNSVRGPMLAALAKYNEYSISKAVEKINSSKHAGSTGWCGVYVRRAVDAGFGKNQDELKSHFVGNAKDFGSGLVSLGFSPINTTIFQIGDIVVFHSPPAGHPNGHIQMFNGEYWVSDYDQRSSPGVDPMGFWPGGDYRDASPQPPYQVYRWELRLLSN